MTLVGVMWHLVGVTWHLPLIWHRARICHTVFLNYFREIIKNLNLYILAKKLDDRQAKLAVVLIHYVERNWINGSFPPETWNMFQHQGETTNNHSEGYNSRLGNKKNIGKHPNFYQWVETIKLRTWGLLWTSSKIRPLVVDHFQVNNPDSNHISLF